MCWAYFAAFPSTTKRAQERGQIARASLLRFDCFSIGEAGHDVLSVSDSFKKHHGIERGELLTEARLRGGADRLARHHLFEGRSGRAAWT